MTIRIDEVKVKLADDADGKVLAYCSIVVSGIAIHEIKIIQTDKRRFLSMPSRKLQARCGKCGLKNFILARYCNECGCRLPDNRGGAEEGQAKLYADIAHPITAEVREAIQAAVLAEYEAELRRGR